MALSSEFETFKNTLPTKNFKVVNPFDELSDETKRNTISYFYPKVGERYTCIEDFELEDFIDFTDIHVGDVLVLERKTPKCLHYRID